uniref:Uncharacterized protein n=1 Tax=Phenylobacterium glaciei TaxID=2803784 RepID=A0A974P2J8_9CAUL|nr:hypothetical protein JKL49_19700 [Phenylobacterium glaciei]
MVTGGGVVQHVLEAVEIGHHLAAQGLVGEQAARQAARGGRRQLADHLAGAVDILHLDGGADLVDAAPGQQGDGIDAHGGDLGGQHLFQAGLAGRAALVDGGQQVLPGPFV